MNAKETIAPVAETQSTKFAKIQLVLMFVNVKVVFVARMAIRMKMRVSISMNAKKVELVKVGVAQFLSDGSNNQLNVVLKFLCTVHFFCESLKFSKFTEFRKTRNVCKHPRSI